MMMSEFELKTPAFLEEFLALDLREQDQGQFANDDAWKTTGLKLITGGPSYTVWVDNLCLALMGVMRMFPRSGEAWIFCDKRVVDYPREVLEATKQAMYEIIEEFKLVRLQAHCLSDWPEANGFVRHLGFHLEAEVKAYGPNLEDYNQYARIESWQ